jgi:glycosyltransferase involved in cell wall biosynthesis
MKIVFLSTILHHAWGGADALWTSAAEHAVERGDSVLLVISEIVAEHPRVRALQTRGAKLHVRPRSDRRIPVTTRALHRVARAVGKTDALVASLEAFAPDLLVFSGGGTYDPLLEPVVCDWLQTTKTPYRVIANFQNEHPSLSEDDRRRVREILIAAERVFFVSARNLAVTRRHLVTPLPNAECIHGVMVHNAPASSAVPWPEHATWGLACVGRLEPVKGIDLLLHALAAALREPRNWQLNIYGRGQQTEYLKEVARELQLADRVVVHGFVDSFADIWRTNHLLVSAAIDEGIPVTIPEAMLHGRAVLATRVGAAEEWIVPESTGFLCPAPTIDLLAATLSQAWREQDQWREMGAAAAMRTQSLYRPHDYKAIIAVRQ